MSLAGSQGYDPIEVSSNIYSKVCRVEGNSELRRYFRFRGGRWYGGVATGDVVGCNLTCKFCWSWRFRNNFSVGKLYTPHQVGMKLVEIAENFRYRYVRLSGAEPTISKKHLLELLKIFDSSNYVFILETNGILVGYDRIYANELSNFGNLVVRVSFKGTSAEEFSLLTGASSKFFELQFKALENLISAGFKAGKDVYAAAMIGFSSDRSIVDFVKMLRNIDPKLVDVDWEYVIMYRHVEDLLKTHNLRPLRAVSPDGVPKEMI
ncbi:MAG: radical SAM protein [Sulfolobales archaeon]|nr:radical SAM protein [Sulfolobales archaeon]MCX8186779.1 radical SAM protein [Sulfolobales archaeon]MDW7969888.1 radical SAM protein [Sulfolobales archaeon]